MAQNKKAKKANSKKSKAVGKKPIYKVAKKTAKKTMTTKVTKKTTTPKVKTVGSIKNKSLKSKAKSASKKMSMKMPKASKKANNKTVIGSGKDKSSAISTSLIGKKISPFSVYNSKGEALTHESLKGRKAVLYFYPKDDTPGCTLEGQQFSKLASEFNNADTVVFGVSKDSVESHDKFICKYDFKIDLISDEKEQLCQIFDVIKEKNMYGKKYMGIERSTFVLDENLTVVKEVRKVSPDGHAQEILEFVKSL